MAIRIYRASLRSGNRHYYFPKQQYSGCSDDQSIACKLEKRTSFTNGDVRGLLYALADLFCESFLNGNYVHIDKLGSFYPTIEYINKEEDADQDFLASNIRIRGIKFQPSVDFIQKLEDAEFVKANVRETLTSRDRRLDNILLYLSQNQSIRSSSAAMLNKCSRSTAQRDLQLLYQTGRIRQIELGVFIGMQSDL